MDEPLKGTRVLDLSRLLPGPYCTLLLADLGADVIKIEEPGKGDYMRELISGVYEAVNRNKRSVTLNLKSKEGCEILYKMVKNADVLVECFRPGVTTKIGIDYSRIKKINNSIIYRPARKPQAFKPGDEWRPERSVGNPAKPGSPKETLDFSPRSFIVPFLVTGRRGRISIGLDIIGISSMSGIHLAALPDLLECLKNRGAQEIIVIAGGIIPSEDIETLEKLGVKKVFPEGSHTYKIVDFIKKEIPLDP